MRRCSVSPGIPPARFGRFAANICGNPCRVPLDLKHESAKARKIVALGFSDRPGLHEHELGLGPAGGIELPVPLAPCTGGIASVAPWPARASSGRCGDLAKLRPNDGLPKNRATPQRSSEIAPGRLAEETLVLPREVA